MEKVDTTAKLVALHKAVGRLLEDPRSRYFDPPVILEFFARWVPVRDALRSALPSVLGDLPARDMPASSGTTDYEGRGYITRQPVQQLHADMQYALDALAALSTVTIPSVNTTPEGGAIDGLEHIAGRSVEKRDVFICHASADKQSHVRPFAAALASAGITYWLDEAEIGWGDRITEKINDGLSRSRYVVVFLTEALLQRQWPQTELGSALSREASSGGVVVLPIMVTSDAQVLAQYPMLRDKHYLRWQDGLEPLISALRTKLGN